MVFCTVERPVLADHGGGRFVARHPLDGQRSTT